MHKFGSWSDRSSVGEAVHRAECPTAGDAEHETSPAPSQRGFRERTQRYDDDRWQHFNTPGVAGRWFLVAFGRSVVAGLSQSAAAADQRPPRSYCSDRSLPGQVRPAIRRGCPQSLGRCFTLFRDRPMSPGRIRATL